MYRSAAFSALLHVAVILLAYFGLPHLARELPPMDLPVPVDIVTVADITNAPPPKPKPEKEKEAPPKPEPKPEPVKAPPPPPPPPEPEAVVPPPPAPKPEPPKPEPPKAIAEAPAPTPKPKLRPEALKDVRPERKPPPPDEMASVLKSVEKLKEKKHEETPVEAAEALKDRAQAPREFNPSAPVTISQIDAIRRHFERCWNIPAGARDAENLAVDIRVALGPDATVQRAEIVEQSRMATDPFYRAAAESALRAVLNPRCRSLQDVGLRPDQYDQWKDMTITFNPKQMIGA